MVFVSDKYHNKPEMVASMPVVVCVEPMSFRKIKVNLPSLPSLTPLVVRQLIDMAGIKHW